MLVVILIVILSMIGLMLTTSYAWYSFSAGSTTFNAVTSAKNIEVTFLKGEYINNTVAVPVKSADVDQYSDKHQFIVRTKNNTIDNEIAVKVSLVDIVIDNSLRVSDFMIDLYHQGSKIGSTVTGNTLAISGAITKELGSAILDDKLDNNFEVRVYLLDNGEDQSALMQKKFQAKIQVDVISKLKANITGWDNPDIYVSSITIDGTTSDSLPTEGLYNMSSSCTKGSTLTWDKLSKTITYNSGSKVNDSCSLTFTKSTDKIYLNTVEPGSYVKYTGTNGCDGKHCEGNNAHYESDERMGYCGSLTTGTTTNFFVNGWRVGYIKDGSAYLVSAGAPECIATYAEYKSSSTSLQTLSTNYYYGSGYTFNSSTGKYSLTGVTASTVAWSSNYESIIANTPYTCKATSSTGTCDTMYQVISYSSETQGNAIKYDNFDDTGNHLVRLNQTALKYCNPEYAYGGVCNENASWALNGDDVFNMIGKKLSDCSIYSSTTGYENCGYNNDLIYIGENYYFATFGYDSSKIWYYYLQTNGYSVSRIDSNGLLGMRPVIRLKSSVLVIGGSGTYRDPYVIDSGNS